VADYTRPLPVINDLNRPHWEGARNHEFLIQRCEDCGHMWFPPMPNCSNCLSTESEWTRVSGRGTVFSYIVYHQGWLPGFKDEVPYNVAIIELDEGVRFINNVVGAPNETIEVGMPVEVTFEDVSPDVTIPRFKPAVG
jgi:uncharacterized OB-fold protein